MSKIDVRINKVIINTYPLFEDKKGEEKAEGGEEKGRWEEVPPQKRHEHMMSHVGDMLQQIDTILGSGKSICRHQAVLMSVANAEKLITNDSDFRSVARAILSNNNDELFERLRKTEAGEDGGLHTKIAIEVAKMFREGKPVDIADFKETKGEQ